MKVIYMLTVNSSKFYRKVGSAGGLDAIAEYKRINFDKYPGIAPYIALEVNFHVENDVKGYLMINLRLGENAPHWYFTQDVNFIKAGRGTDIPLTITMPNIEFSEPGSYFFDIVFNDVLLHSAGLEIA